jgi:hypothetical protein
LRVGAEQAAAVLLDVVGDLVPGIAGDDDKAAGQVRDAHEALPMEADQYEPNGRRCALRRAG